METRVLAVWAVTDGAAGNMAQALGLAEAIARHRSAELRHVRIGLRSWASCVPPRFWQLLPWGQGGWPFRAYRDGAAPAPPWPDLAIGAGRRVAPLVAALRAVHGVRAVQIMDPRMSAAAFDLLVAPDHDRLAGPNVITTLGAVSRITPESVAAEAARHRERFADLPEPRVAVLVGGPGKRAFWREDDVDRFVRCIAALSRSGAGLMVTASRRTDPVVMAGLRAACDPATTRIWDGTGDNPYPGILGLARAAVVTEDSVNMASEVATAGLPLHVFRISGPSRRIAAFHRTLIDRGIERDFDGRVERWDYVPLAEADRAAALVLGRLFLVPPPRSGVHSGRA